MQIPQFKSQQHQDFKQKSQIKGPSNLACYLKLGKDGYM